MVCLERWIRCLFLLVMFSAVHHCVFLQPPNEVISEAPDYKNVSSLLPQKQICDNISILQHADPNNKTIGRVPLCAENATSPSVQQNSTNSSSDSKISVPSEFPKEGLNIKTTNTIQDTLHLSNNSQNETDPHDEKISTKIETSTNQPTLNITYPVNNTAVNSSKIDTEVSDLLNTTVNCLTPNQIPDSAPNITYNKSEQIDRDVELIENGENTEDVLRRNSTLKEKVSNPGVPLVQGQLAAILAGVFVVISVIAYVGLLSWRRYLENRYGDRQMLVNEDNFNDDLKHFSI
ncbi:uncharacterized protein LOC108909194 isoform X1 [Anoplophora glabripennis]|uniref:Uncharacterized protein n=1 Tax=Anoplophora glabripennis TaxID=217634 RepID=V5IAD9_ANOGL|nr:uncharacterized protein LOC108909194 isoform X1 [Anoplophora glabripennis]